jgi:hypothetical protein
MRKPPRRLSRGLKHVFERALAQGMVLSITSLARPRQTRRTRRDCYRVGVDLRCNDTVRLNGSHRRDAGLDLTMAPTPGLRPLAKFKPMRDRQVTRMWLRRRTWSANQGVPWSVGALRNGKRPRRFFLSFASAGGAAPGCVARVEQSAASRAGVPASSSRRSANPST